MTMLAVDDVFSGYGKSRYFMVSVYPLMRVKLSPSSARMEQAKVLY